MIAEDAQRLLNDPAFKEVLTHMETQIIRQMKRSPLANLDTHHELVLYLQLLESMKAVLGKLAQGQSVSDFNAKMAKSVS